MYLNEETAEFENMSIFSMRLTLSGHPGSTVKSFRMLIIQRKLLCSLSYSKICSGSEF